MVDMDRCGKLLTGWARGLADGEARRLNEPEVYRLLEAAGIRWGRSAVLEVGADGAQRQAWAAAAVELAAGPGRVLLKVVGRHLLHKSDLGGVQVVDLAAGGEASLLAAADAMAARVAAAAGEGAVEGVLAAAFVPHRANQPGQELLLSVRQDSAFGPVVVVGVGGTLTEWYGGAAAGGSTLVFPATGLDEGDVASALAAHPLLKLTCSPSRLYDAAPFDLDEVAQVVGRLARLARTFAAADDGATLEELEINPAVAGPDGLTAIDGVGLLSRRRQQRARRPLERVEALLTPRSAAVLGVSARGANPGRIILDNLKRSQSVQPGRLWVVHPEEDAIAGVPCVRTVADLPERCDLAVVSIPAGGALEAIEQLVAQDKARSIILIPGGFAETGETGLARAIEDVLESAHAAGGGPVMVGGNCLGIVSRDRYNTFFLPPYKLPFRPGLGDNLALVSQSGAYLVTFASNYDGIISPCASISYGNQMDLTVADFLEHFLDDSAVDVIACYVEGFRDGDGERFVRLAAEARRRGKRVVVFKAGRTALGAQAAASHTASLAGDYAVARACLESAGVTVADSLDHFEDLIKTFTLLAGRPARGRRTGIISNAGFECSTVMDELDGLELAEYDPATQARLDAALPSFAHRTNPIDCTPMTGTEAFAESCAAILDSPNVDAAILSSVPVTPALDNLEASPEGAHSEDLDGPRSQPTLMAAAIAASAKPAVIVVDSGRIYDPMCRRLEQAGIPVFRKIDRAARALAAFCRDEERSS